METSTLPLELLRYPLGRYEAPPLYGSAFVKQSLTSLEALPAKLRAAVHPLSDEQLDTPYRPGGWTLRQVVHHVADSHINAYTRFRLALTEDIPVIKPYQESPWAYLHDAHWADPALSLQLLEALHQRWIILLRSLCMEEWHRSFYHPESGEVYLFQAAGMYAWHGEHHVGHIDSLKQRMGW
ncbi:YfiT family bacillithiol transferase [Rufibacter sediminis]|uniref:Bacillithiol transferase BstA n=1 Tax=Rufibacter sediminis TaxID=2762756 RepID=A0ABR6VR39_9BACT|nr:bacillithiol transferase BstA [Rufibacter sediminis]MBC3539046.1 bacillithiol transferase BstA [Rufibacter sediminis]